MSTGGKTNKKQVNSYCRTPEMRSTSYVLKIGGQGESLHIPAAAQPARVALLLPPWGKTRNSFSTDVKSDSCQLQVGRSSGTENRRLCENLPTRLVSALVPLLPVSSRNAAGTRSRGRRFLGFFYDFFPALKNDVPSLWH